MYPLLNFFVDLCLLRVPPQTVPASEVLLRLTFVTNVLVGFLLMVGNPLSPGLALLESLLEVGLSLLALRVGLTLMRHPARFIQTATGLMGSSTLLGLAALPALQLGRGDGEVAALGALLVLLLAAWSLVVLGHILRHAFQIQLSQGIAIGAIYTVLSYLLVTSLFPLD